MLNCCKYIYVCIQIYSQWYVIMYNFRLFTIADDKYAKGVFNNALYRTKYCKYKQRFKGQEYIRRLYIYVKAILIV